MAGDLGHGILPAAVGKATLVWSADALADLDRFAGLRHLHHPALAARVARAIIAETALLADHPKLGCPLASRPD